MHDAVLQAWIQVAVCIFLDKGIFLLMQKNQFAIVPLFISITVLIRINKIATDTSL